MNVTMVDVTNIANAAPGDTVTLIGSAGDERIEAEDVGHWAHSVRYEIVARLPAEIPRTPACYVSGLFYDRFGNPSYVVLANPLLVNTTVTAPPTPHIINIRRTPAPIRTPIHAHPPTGHVPRVAAERTMGRAEPRAVSDGR